MPDTSVRDKTSPILPDHVCNSIQTPWKKCQEGLSLSEQNSAWMSTSESFSAEIFTRSPKVTCWQGYGENSTGPSNGMLLRVREDEASFFTA